MEIKIQFQSQPKTQPVFDVGLIVAASQNGVIGVGGGLPWIVPEDTLRFRTISSGTKKLVLDDFKNWNWLDCQPDLKKPNICFMGKNTAQGIPDKFFPLQGRINIVITKTKKINLATKYHKEGVYIVESYKEFYELLQTTLKGKYEDIFICGGAQIYQDFLKFKVDGFRLKTVYLTRIHQEIPITSKISFVEELTLSTKLCKDGSLPHRWFDEFKILDQTNVSKLEYEFLDYIRK